MGKRKYSVNDSFLDVSGKTQSWFVGLIAADGNLYKQKESHSGMINISQSGDEGLKLVQFIKNLIYTNSKISENKTTHQMAYRLSFTSKPIFDHLIDFGITPNKTKVLEFPLIENLDIKSFLRGYFDGDGSVGIYTTNTTTYLCASMVGTEKFIKDSLKYFPEKPVLRKLEQCENLFEARWNGEKACIMLDWLWSDEDMFEWYKHDTYKYFIQNYEPRYIKYKRLEQEVLNLLKKGKTYRFINKELGVGFGFIKQCKDGIC